jgi:hypothetical protein
VSKDFNLLSDRKVPSSVPQLIKVAQGIRTTERTKADTLLRINKQNESKFKKFCFKKGCGVADKELEG